MHLEAVATAPVKPSRKIPRNKKPPYPCATLSILEFCQFVGISRAYYYELTDKPVETRFGGKILVSKTAAEDWLRAHSTQKSKAA